LYYATVSAGRRATVYPSTFEAQTQDPDTVPLAISDDAENITAQGDFDYLYNAFYAYFASEVIDSAAFDCFQDTLAALLQNEYMLAFITDDTIANVSTFYLQILNNFNSELTSDQASKTLSILGPYSASIDRDTLISILDLTLSLTFAEQVLGSSVYLSGGGISIYRQRDEASVFNMSTVQIGELLFAFPADLPLNSSEVYDLSFFQFDQAGTVFELVLYFTGTYDNFTLTLSTPTLLAQDFSTPVEVTIQDSFDPSASHECVYLENADWTSGGCNIMQLTDSYAQLAVELSATFIVRESPPNCDTGSGPIATMSVLVFLMILLSLVFLARDRDVEKYPRTKKLFLLYPLSSLFFEQPMRRRAVVLVQLLTTELLMLTLIGAFYEYFDDPTQKTYVDFGDYYGRQMRKGAVGWFLTQGFAIPVFVASSYMLSGKRWEWISVPLCLIVTLGCIAGMVVMTVYYCLGYTEFWIATFLMFVGFDLFTLQVIYAVIMTCLVDVPEALYITGDETGRSNVPEKRKEGYEEEEMQPKEEKKKRKKKHKKEEPVQLSDDLEVKVEVDRA
jgi:hypothetical protein